MENIFESGRRVLGQEEVDSSGINRTGKWRTECVICSQSVPDPGEGRIPVCDDCVKASPGPLLLACTRGGEFLLGLRDGSVIHFCSASVAEKDSQWAHLSGVTEMYVPVAPGHKMPIDGGIEVRLSEISWCCELGGRREGGRSE
jgi:hypothetical protein